MCPDALPCCRIGPEYRKALYREYTDATFTSLKARPEAEQHLGLLGPVIRTVVGDTVKVVFRNNARFPYSVHAHGLRYTKVNEGAKCVAAATWNIVQPRARPRTLAI